MVPKNESTRLVVIALCLSLQILHVYSSLGPISGTKDGSEQWGYVEVRPKAHLFWWLYKSPHRVEDPSKPWPTILWLQGGPGGSGVGFGNFKEIGPLDSNLEPRNLTWLNKADLLFVDSPVGTGFSYVEEEGLVVKTDYEAAADLTTLLMAELYNNNAALQRSPLFIFAESYGGKFAVTLALTALQAIEAGKLKLQLGGVALGDSWISPEDFVFSWGPLLKDMSRLDARGLNASNSLAMKIQQQIKQGEFKAATNTWELLEDVILSSSNGVSFYNFMLDYGSGEGGLSSLMNGPIKKKLGVIPENITWGGQDNIVFPAMASDFMKPRIDEVDMLLSKPINVTIYNGQLDLICSTKGVEAWLSKLKWDGLAEFLNENRTPLYCGENDLATRAFFASHKNLFFYWILGAGHMVPTDQPCISLQMVGRITQSPSNFST